MKLPNLIYLILNFLILFLVSLPINCQNIKNLVFLEETQLIHSIECFYLENLIRIENEQSVANFDLKITKKKQFKNGNLIFLNGIVYFENPVDDILGHWSCVNSSITLKFQFIKIKRKQVRSMLDGFKIESYSSINQTSVAVNGKICDFKEDNFEKFESPCLFIKKLEDGYIFVKDYSLSNMDSFTFIDYNLNFALCFTFQNENGLYKILEIDRISMNELCPSSVDKIIKIQVEQLPSSDICLIENSLISPSCQLISIDDERKEHVTFNKYGLFTIFCYYEFFKTNFLLFKECLGINEQLDESNECVQKPNLEKHFLMSYGRNYVEITMEPNELTKISQFADVFCTFPALDPCSFKSNDLSLDFNLDKKLLIIQSSLLFQMISIETVRNKMELYIYNVPGYILNNNFNCLFGYQSNIIEGRIKCTKGILSIYYEKFKEPEKTIVLKISKPKDLNMMCLKNFRVGSIGLCSKSTTFCLSKHNNFISEKKKNYKINSNVLPLISQISCGDILIQFKFEQLLIEKSFNEAFICNGGSFKKIRNARNLDILCDKEQVETDYNGTLQCKSLDISKFDLDYYVTRTSIYYIECFIEESLEFSLNNGFIAYGLDYFNDFPISNYTEYCNSHSDKCSMIEAKNNEKLRTKCPLNNKPKFLFRITHENNENLQEFMFTSIGVKDVDDGSHFLFEGNSFIFYRKSECNIFVCSDIDNSFISVITDPLPGICIDEDEKPSEEIMIQTYFQQKVEISCKNLGETVYISHGITIYSNNQYPENIKKKSDNVFEIFLDQYSSTSFQCFSCISESHRRLYKIKNTDVKIFIVPLIVLLDICPNDFEDILVFLNNEKICSLSLNDCPIDQLIFSEKFVEIFVTKSYTFQCILDYYSSMIPIIMECSSVLYHFCVETSQCITISSLCEKTKIYPLDEKKSTLDIKWIIIIVVSVVILIKFFVFVVFCYRRRKISKKILFNNSSSFFNSNISINKSKGSFLSSRNPPTSRENQSAFNDFLKTLPNKNTFRETIFM